MRNYGNGSLLGVSNQPGINQGYGIWDFNTIARALLDSKWGVTTGISKLGTDVTGLRTTSGNTLTATHTLLSGSYRVSWCLAATESGNSIASATYGGVGATGMTEKVYSTQNTRIRLFYVLDANLPATGSRDWVVTFSGNVTYAAMACGTIQGAYQGAPEASNSGESGSTPVTTGLTTLTDGAYIIGGACSINGSTNTYSGYGSGQTEIYNVNTTSAQTSFAATYELKATAGADTQSFSRTSAVNMVAFAAAFKPA